MIRERDSNINTIKEKQAISEDYSDTGYDRGHLNPNSFQCDEGRKATFTLTNAAPMDACFNRIHWKSWESTTRSFLLSMLINDGSSAEAYIVTGTVPSANVRIPQQEVSNDPKRVTVPSHIWTAVCYKHQTEPQKSFSFSYLGKNLPEGGISLMSVSNLNIRLGELYGQLSGTSPSISVFADDCFEDNNKLNKVQNAFQKLINLAANQVVEMSSSSQNTYNALQNAISDYSIPSKKIKVSQMTVKLAFDSLSTYLTVAEVLKTLYTSACLITRAKSLVRGLEKRDLSDASSDAVECLLVPEDQITAADGSSCSSIYITPIFCSCHPKPGDGAKPCCISPCLYQAKLQDYRCYSGQDLISCSPQYSLITVSGEMCKDEQPCATYGYDYYWCSTTSGKWDYCSPPLWNSKAENGKYCRTNHACAKYGESKPWCYTDDEGTRGHCCTSDDCYSAVNGKTCRPNHKCSNYGQTYLWCYIDDDDNWEYCCTKCSY